MISIKDLPIQRKLTFVVMVIVSVILSLVTSVSALNDWFMFKRGVVQGLDTAAQIIAANSTAALTFHDSDSAEITLKSLAAKKQFTLAVIYDSEGQQFATYSQNNELNTHVDSTTKLEDGFEFHEDYVDLITSIYLDDERIGTVFIRSDLSEMHARVMRSMGIFGLVLLVSIVLALLLSKRMQGVITKPILHLEQISRRVSEEGDYSIRVNKYGEDELGCLADRFNEMLSVIHERNQELQEHHEQLEEQVAVRTAELAEQKERAEVTLHSIGDGVITADDKGIIEYLNPVAEHLTGWRKNEAVGQPVDAVFKIIDEVTRKKAENPMTKCLRTGRIVTFDSHTVLIAHDGTEYAIDESAAPIRGHDGETVGVIVVFHDVGNERKLKNQLTWQATHDALTGLTNRLEFEHRLGSMLSSATVDDYEHALLYLDLDQFKVVNDTCGHVAGDELLKQLTGKLKAQIREVDTLARLGGDEFGVLLSNCPLEQAALIAEKLREAVRVYRFGWESHSFDIGVSIGLVPINSLSGTHSEILAAADVACYAAKDMGRDRVHIYEHDDTELARRHGEIRWVSRLQLAMEEDRFQIFGQAIAPIASDQPALMRYEILVRLKDTDGTLIPPGAFIAAAERYNMMPAIDRVVIEKTFKVCAELINVGFDKIMYPSMPPLFSVNMSGTTLNDIDFLEFIHQLFAQYKVPPSMLCFEITETAAIASLAQTTHFMMELKQIGCRFALDDFGSGLSSFAYLKQLPVDYLKIDGMFVKEIVNDKIDLAMVKSINEIGHVMGMKTIAEFVEDEEIFKVLKTVGVDYAQGYWIHKPQILTELVPIIKETFCTDGLVNIKTG